MAHYLCSPYVLINPIFRRTIHSHPTEQAASGLPLASRLRYGSSQKGVSEATSTWMGDQPITLDMSIWEKLQPASVNQPLNGGWSSPPPSAQWAAVGKRFAVHWPRWRQILIHVAFRGAVDIGNSCIEIRSLAGREKALERTENRGLHCDEEPSLFM